MEEDGFQLVSRKKSTRATKRPRDTEEYGGDSSSILVKKIERLREEIGSSSFFRNAVDSIATCSAGAPLTTSALCYGIGHVGSCPTALHQLALMLLVTQHMQIQEVLLYDPILHQEEISFIEQLGILVVSHNECCKHHVTHPTLVYMPHCSLAMYNNLLWANWSCLSHVTLLGNRLGSYRDRLPAKKLEEKFYYVFYGSMVCVEVPLQDTHSLPNVFNNLAVHVFPTSRQSIAPSNVWACHQEPVVDPDDPETIY